MTRLHLHLFDGSDVVLEFPVETQPQGGLNHLVGERQDELKREWIAATLGDRRIVVQRAAVMWFMVEENV